MNEVLIFEQMRCKATWAEPALPLMHVALPLTAIGDDSQEKAALAGIDKHGNEGFGKHINVDDRLSIETRVWLILDRPIKAA